MKKIQKLFSRQARTGLLLGIFVFQTILPFGIHTKETTVTAAELLDTPELQKLAETRPDLTTSHTENLLEKIKNQPAEVTETISEISGQSEVSDLTELKDLQNKAFKKAKKVKAEQKEREEELKESREEREPRVSEADGGAPEGVSTSGGKHESASDELTPDSEKTFDAETATEEELIEKLEEAGIIQTDETEDGETILVNPTLEETGIFTKTLKTNSTAHEIEIPLKNPAKAKITNEVEDTEFTLEFEPFYANEVEASYADNKVLSKNIFKETDLLQTTTKDGIKEDLILKNEAAPTSFLYSLDSNLTPRLSPRGELQMIDQRGVARFTSPKPIVYDAEGKQETAEYKLLTKSEAEAWLTEHNPNLLTVTNLTQTTDGWIFDETEPTPTPKETITELLDETEEQAEPAAEGTNDEEYINSESASSSEEVNDEEDIEIENNSAILNEAEEQPEDSSVTPLPQNDNSAEETAETETTSFLQTLHNLLIPEAIADDEVEEENDPVILSEAKNLEDEQTEEASNEEVLATEEPTLEEEVQSEENNSVILNEVKNLEEQQPEDSSVASLSQNDNSEEEISNEEEPLDEAHQLLETLKDTDDTQLAEIRTQLSLTLDDLDFYHEELETAEDEKRITQLNNLIKEANEKKAELIASARQEQNYNPTITNQNGEIIQEGTHAAASTQTKSTEALFLLVYIPEATLTNLTYPLDLDPTVVTSSTYEIANSALFDGVDDYLSWTPASAGDRKTWTWSGWVKIANSESRTIIFSASSTQYYRTEIRLDRGDFFILQEEGNNNTKFKVGIADAIVDSSSFYHLAVEVDTGNITENERVRIYLNGERVTNLDYEIYPNQYLDTFVNDTVIHRAAAGYLVSDPYFPFDGYLADTYFLDGVAAEPTDFGQEINNQWLPRAYEGNYGTNGFHLDFSNSGSLGEDSSGNNNDLTVNGAPTQTIDTPTNNFVTFNPLDWMRNTGCSTSNGNLTISTAGGIDGCGFKGTLKMPESGKWYWAYQFSDSNSRRIGFANEDLAQNHATIRTDTGAIYENGIIVETANSYTTNDWIGIAYDADSGAVQFYKNGVVNGSQIFPDNPRYLHVSTANTVAMNGTAEFGSTGFTYAPPDGYSALSTANLPDPTIADSSQYAEVITREGGAGTLNPLNMTSYTSGEWTISASSEYPGYEAWRAANGSLVHPSGYWSTKVYTVTSGDPAILTLTTTGDKKFVDAYSMICHSSLYPDEWTFQGSNDGVSWDILDTRAESGASGTFQLSQQAEYQHYRIHMTSAGGDSTYIQIAEFKLISQETKIESLNFQPDFLSIKDRDNAYEWMVVDSTRGAYNVINTNSSDAEWATSESVESFDANGYTLNSNYRVNQSGDNYLDLALKEDPAAGFDIVRYSGQNNSQTISHNLGKVPTFMIIKNLSYSSYWAVYHKDLGASSALVLNDTLSTVGGYWNDTEPTDTEFSVSYNRQTSIAGDDYIAYLFTDSDVYKAFSYTGNGNADGPFVNLGGKPLSIPFAKNSLEAGQHWINFDSKRDPFNPVVSQLFPNLSDAEYPNPAAVFDFTNNGFKVKQSDAQINGSSNLHIGLAILDHGIKPPVGLNTNPLAPTLVSPADGGYTNDDTPTLSATYVDNNPGDTGTVSYRIATSAAGCLDNSTVVASGTSATTADENEITAWTPSSSIGAAGEYFWCTQANDGTLLSSWTSMGSFQLDSDSATVLTSDNTTNLAYHSTPTDPDSTNLTDFQTNPFTDTDYTNSITADSTTTDTTASGGQYEIQNSALFDSGAGDSLVRTPLSTGDRRKFTIRQLVKGSNNGVNTDMLFRSANAPLNIFQAFINGNDQIQINNYNSSIDFGIATQAYVFSDPSAWYDIVIAVDTTQVIETDRIKLYIDGVRYTDLITGDGWPALNFETWANTLNPHNITNSSYISDAYFFDGQALDASTFGEEINNQWVPKDPGSLTYGTNGFHLDFTNSSNLGEDSSGSGNDFTVNGAPIQTIDTPTNNFATMNPLDFWQQGSANITLTEGNLQGTAIGSPGINATIGVDLGKWYFEGVPLVREISYTSPWLGVQSFDGSKKWYFACGDSNNGWAISTEGGNKDLGSVDANDVVQFAVDMDSGKMWFGKNGTWLEGDPATGVGATFTSLTGVASPFMFLDNNTPAASAEFNFGATGFTYDPPAGYSALSTANLPDPTITNTRDYADVVLYDGDETGPISIDSLNFAPDWINVKNRTSAFNWSMWDTKRPGYNLATNITSGQATEGTATLNENGFIVNSSPNLNRNGDSFVATALKEDPTAGFDIVTYTGNGVAGHQIPHELGKAPTFMIVKDLDSATNWFVYHKDLGSTTAAYLNATSAAAASVTYWNNTDPNSNYFTVGNGPGVNASGNDYVAYLFADSDVYKAFSYTGNGDADGPFVNLGGKPLAIPFLKNSENGQSWKFYNSAVDPFNPISKRMSCDLSAAEVTVNEAVFTSSGLKIPVGEIGINESGSLHVGLAILDHGMKPTGNDPTYASQMYTYDTSTYNVSKLAPQLRASATAEAGNGITAKIWNSNTTSWETLTSLTNISSTTPNHTSGQLITSPENYIDGGNKVRILVQATNPSTTDTNSVLQTDLIQLQVWGESLADSITPASAYHASPTDPTSTTLTDFQTTNFTAGELTNINTLDTTTTATNGDTGSYQIQNSALFDGTDDYLSRVVPTVGDVDKATFYFNIKISEDNNSYYPFTNTWDGDNRFQIAIDSNGTFSVLNRYGGINSVYLQSVAKFTDGSDHYSVVVSIDTTQTIQDGRVKVWIDGSPVTLSGTWPILNTDLQMFAQSWITNIAYDGVYTAYTGGYISDIYVLDGQALPASTFGEEINNRWMPKDPGALTYGTNGFHLDFSNAADLGEDSSGNNNDFTVQGAPTQTIDTPTNNFMTFNPLDSRYTSMLGMTGGNNNIQPDGTTTGGVKKVGGTLSIPNSGKYYLEYSVKINPDIGAAHSVGEDGIFFGDLDDIQEFAWGASYPSTYNVYGASVKLSSLVNVSSHVGTTVTQIDSSYSENQIIQMAIDFDNGKCWIGKNGTWYDSGDPQNNLNETFSFSIDSDLIRFAGSISQGGDYSGEWLDAFFGSTGFTYTPPTGYSALSTANLPDPTISNNRDYADVITRTGTGVETSIDSLNFQPDWVNIKTRNAVGYNWDLFDAERGAAKSLHTNTTGAESTDVASLLSFDPNGYTLGADVAVNNNGWTYLDLALKEDPTAGFDIVKYIGNGIAGRQIPHDLGKVPTFMIVKNLSSSSYNWIVYHKAAGLDAGGYLNTSGAFESSGWQANIWQDLTENYWQTGNGNYTNAVGNDYIAYLFTDSDVYKSFSYTGNGDADGPFVNLGGKPLWSFTKNADTAGFHWKTTDSVRYPTNPMSSSLNLNGSFNEAESVFGPAINYLSQGIKIITDNANFNESGSLHIGLAILDHGIKPPTIPSSHASQLLTFDTSGYSVTALAPRLAAYATAEAGDGITAKIWDNTNSEWDSLAILTNTASTLPTTVSTQLISNPTDYIDGSGIVRMLIYSTNPSTSTTAATLTTDLAGLQIYGAVSDTTGPTITVTSPNGGEDWSTHETHDITWTATDVSGVEPNSITIAYSTNGTDWTEIANSEANDGTYTWTPPNTTNSNYQIRITAEDTLANSGSDTSDSTFSLTAANDWNTVEITAGNNQTATTVVETLATELQVRVSNGLGSYATAAAETVTFDITSVPTTPTATDQTLTAGTNGTATPVDSDTITVTTDASGYASATLKTGDRAGTYTVTATIGDGTGDKTVTFTATESQVFDLQITEASSTLNLTPGTTNTTNNTLNLTVTTNAASYELTNTLNQLPKNGTYQLNNWSGARDKFGWEWNSSNVKNDFAAATSPVTIFTCNTGDDCRGTKNYTVDLHADVADTRIITGTYTSTLTTAGASITY